MTSNLNDVLKQFETVEANLDKLQRLWGELEKYAASASSNTHDAEDEANYEENAGKFRHILAVMPAIDGYRLEDAVMGYNDIFISHVESSEVGEIASLVDHRRQVGRQRDLLRDYRLRLRAKRRELARLHLNELCKSVDTCLGTLAADTEGFATNATVTDKEGWQTLRQAVKSIAALLGGNAKPITRWDLLNRHLHFGMKGDLDDIVTHDWPSVKAGLVDALCGADDPLPVSTDDIGSLVKSNPRGPIVTELRWGQLDDAVFERLIYNLFSKTKAYENPEWLTHTNAPDKGRDISVIRVHQDELAGTKRERVIVACKHWLSKSVGVAEFGVLKEQARAHEPPRVDVLIIVTSGRFSSDCVQRIEQHNLGHDALRVEMWPNSHLELLLAKKPELIAEFKLR
jgi:hypothetical protein